MKSTICAVLLLAACSAVGEQVKEVNGWKIHYSVFNSTFLQPEVAERLGLTRSKNRTLLVISILNPDDKPTDVSVKGSYRNLLEQETVLNFERVEDGDGFYRVASFVADNEETLRFRVAVELPSGEEQLNFTQKIYHAE